MPDDPPQIPVAVPAPVGAAAEQIASSSPSTPKDSGIRATKVMPAVAAAGVRLVTIVLSMAAASIVILIAYLFYMDLVVGWNIQDAYGQILGRNKLGSEVNALFDLEAFDLDLASMRDNPAFVLDPRREQRDRELVATLQRLPSLSQDEKARLDTCILLPSAPSVERMQRMQGCVVLVRKAGDEAVRAAGSGMDLQTAADAVTKLADGRQALHSFWLQAAQLILLNLLLPILTALLGYIFGTQQQAQHDREGP